MSEMIVWKKSSLVAVGGIVLCGLTFWVARSTAPKPVMVPAVVSIPAAPSATDHPSPTDFLKCIEGNTTAKKTFFETMLRNRCNVGTESFVAKFKLYDLTDARVGWAEVPIGELEPGEKVRFRVDYDVKENPKLVEGVGRVALYDMVPQK